MNNPNFGALAGFETPKIEPVAASGTRKTADGRILGLLQESNLERAMSLKPTEQGWKEALDLKCWLGSKSAQHIQQMAPHHIMNSIRMLREERHSTLKGNQAIRAIEILIIELEERLIRGHLDAEKEHADVEKFLK